MKTLKNYMIVTTILLLLSLFHTNVNAQVCFSATTNYPAGISPKSVTNSDFNGDGKMDLAICNYNSPVSILTGNGTGGFAVATNVTMGGYGPQFITSADFNGDGKMDLAVTHYIVDSVSVALGNGLGSFSAPVRFSGGTGFGASCVISADFNKDGKMDLALGYESSTNISILTGDGLGNFSAAVNFSVGGAPRSIASDDFNGDGKMDIATANWNPGNISVLIGNGTGNFSPSADFVAGGNPTSIICADFNGDGKIDLATANSAGDVSVLTGDGLGGFSTTNPFVVGMYPMSLINADFNGDGKMDIATANTNSDDVSILIGDGLGSFSTPVNFVVGDAPYSIVSADFNGDSKMDLATANFYTYDVSVLLNCANITDQGMNENISVSIIHVFPNPSNGNFVIEIDNQLFAKWTNPSSDGQAVGKMDVEIYNILGEKICPSNSLPSRGQQQVASAARWAIDISNQPNGVYFLNAKTERESFTQKLIIQK